MKFIQLFFLTAVSLAGSLLSSAQSFTDPHRVFYQYNAPSGCPAPCRFITTTAFRFAGDTVIDTTSYRKILSLKDSLSSWQLIGFVRETPAGKVYLKKLYQDGTTSEEGLTYDFSLSPGDTMYFDNPFFIEFSDTVVLVRLDTTEIFDSARKVLYLQSLTNHEIAGSDYYEEWIEGIGSLTGPLLSGFHFNPWVGSFNTLLCVYYDNQLIYSNPDFDKCYYNTTDAPLLPGDNTTAVVSPDPVTDVSYLKVTGLPGDYLLEIFSPGSRLLLKRRVRSGEQVTLRAAAFPPGVCFFRVTVKNRSPLTGKFMVIRK